MISIVNEKDNVAAIVAEAVGLSSTPQGRLWPDDVYSAVPFYDVNGSTPTALFSVKDANAFKKKIDEDIDLIVDTDTPREFKLVRMTGFIALTLWRAATKNKNQLSNAFLKRQYRLDLHDFAGWWANELPFSPPCERCIEICIGSLRKGLPTTSKMYILLASEYVLSQKADYRDPYSAGYLNASVLTHTAKNGLGMLQLLEQTMHATQLDWLSLYKKSYFKETASLWDTIRNFLTTYLDKDSRQFGYNWTRIINDGYLRGLSPKDMLPLAGIFAGVLEPIQGPGIWNTEWFKNRKEWLSEMRKIGKTLYEETKATLAARRDIRATGKVNDEAAALA